MCALVIDDDAGNYDLPRSSDLIRREVAGACEFDRVVVGDVSDTLRATGEGAGDHNIRSGEIVITVADLEFSWANFVNAAVADSLADPEQISSTGARDVDRLELPGKIDSVQAETKTHRAQSGRG